MKIEKKFRLFCGMLAALLFASCTLVMDDLPAESDIKAYAEDIETVGFDEPYTQETEYGDITFQYGDSTNVLKKAAFDYLIKVDGDSILYFTDNIPSELLVRPGYYVSMGCSRILPQGLCSKVLSLVHEPGMYKMVTTRVAQEEVFDQFNMDLNVDYQTMISTIECDDETEIVETDSTAEFSVYDLSAIDGSQTRSITRGTPIDYTSSISGTRGNVGDGEGTDEEGTWTDRDENVDRDKDKFSEESIPVISISTADAAGSTSDEKSKFVKKMTEWMVKHSAIGNVFSKLKDAGLDAGLSISYNSQKHVSIKTVLDKDPKKSVREEMVEDNSKFIIDVDISKSKSHGSTTQDPEKVFSQVESIMRKGWDCDKETGIAVKLGISIPAAPAVIVFLRVAPHVKFELGIVGRLECSYVLPTTVTYTKTIGNEDVTPNDKKKPTLKNDGGFKFEKASIFGYAKVEGGIEICLGVGAGAPGFGFETESTFTGLGIGADFNISLTLNAGYNSKHNLTDETNIVFDITLSPIVRMFFFKWNHKITLTSWKIYTRTFYMLPTYGECELLYVPVYEDKFAECTVRMSYDSRGIMAYLFPKAFSPVARLYYESTSGEKYVDMECSTTSTTFNEGTYRFKTVLTDVVNVKYVITGYRYGDKTYLFNDKKTLPSIEGQPYLKPSGLYWTDFEPSFDFSDNPVDYNIYSFTYRVALCNAQYMKGNWTGWGLHAQIEKYYPEYKSYLPEMDRYIKLSDLKSNATYNVSFKFKTKSSEGHRIIIFPVYWDAKGELSTYYSSNVEYMYAVAFGYDNTDNIKSAPKGGTKWSVSL